MKADDSLAYTAMFGSLYVTGDDYPDKVCVNNLQTCVNPFRFISVTDLDPRIIPIDGMLGLAPDDPNNGPSFVAALYDNNMISKLNQRAIIFRSEDVRVYLWTRPIFKSDHFRRL